MLILSRRPGQKIMIGDDVVVQVVDVQGDKVRLGVSAPSDVPVDREEIRKAKDKEKQDESKS